MRFLIDMNLSPAWASELAVHGFQAVHWGEVGNSDATDEEILSWAARHGWTIMTADLDFGAIVTTRELATAVVQLRSGSTNPARVSAVVAQAIKQAGTGLRAGAVLTVEPGRSRLRSRASPLSPIE